MMLRTGSPIRMLALTCMMGVSCTESPTALEDTDTPPTPSALAEAEILAVARADVRVRALQRELEHRGCAFDDALHESGPGLSSRTFVSIQLARCTGHVGAAVVASVHSSGVVTAASASHFGEQGTTVLRYRNVHRENDVLVPADIVERTWTELRNLLVTREVKVPPVTETEGQLAGLAQAQGRFCSATVVFGTSTPGGGCCFCQSSAACAVAEFNSLGVYSQVNALWGIYIPVSVCADEDEFDPATTEAAAVAASLFSASELRAFFGASGNQLTCHRGPGMCSAPVCNEQGAACMPISVSFVRCQSGDESCSPADEKDIYTSQIGGGLVCNFGTCAQSGLGGNADGVNACNVGCMVPEVETAPNVEPVWACKP